MTKRAHGEQGAANGPRWLQDLHASDQVIGRRLLQDVGARAMHRIFKAMPKRRRGGPEREFSAEEINRALHIYLAEPDMKARTKRRTTIWGAAGKLADELGLQHEEKANYQRLLSKRLQAFQNPASEEMEHLAWLAGAMEERGERVRSDLFPEQPQPQWLRNFRPTFARLGLRVESQAVTPDLSGQNAHGQRVVRIQATMMTRKLMAQQKAPHERLAFGEDVIRFSKAFQHILPEDLPASEVDQLYRRVEGFLRADLGDQRATARNP